MSDQQDRLSAFRKFIEESLDLEQLAASLPSNEDAPSPHPISPARIPENVGFVPTPEQMASLYDDIEIIWEGLQKDRDASNGWQSLLTLFERDTLNIITRLMLTDLNNKRAGGGKLDAQDIIRSSITAGWLVMAMLINKYAHEADSGDMGDGENDIPF
ncbi:MAG: hypothetical protein DIU68_012590 [Chloroflexota bacterium]|nr:MAG: hypothetical protein DIU68_07290 [Chloroflexota bacterium]